MLLNPPDTGHSVDVASGDMQFHATDFDILGKVNLTWHRMYAASARQQDSPFGYGWHSPFFASLEWQAETNQYQFTTPDNNSITFTLDGQKEQSRIIEYGSFAELLIEKDKLVVCQWDAETGEAWYYWFDRLADHSVSKLNRITDASSQGVELTHNARGLLIKVRQIQENRTFLLRYGQGKISQIDFALPGNETAAFFRYEYDGQGCLVKETNTEGASRTYQYNKDRQLTAVQYKNGSTYDFAYDDDGRCLYAGTKQGFGSKHFTYFPLVGKTEVTNTKGDKTWHQCNTDGQIVEETNAYGAISTTELDEHGRIIAETDTNGNITRYGYDQYGNRSLIQDAAGNSIQITYQDFHKPIQYTNEKGHQWRRTYDGQNRLSSISTPTNEQYHFVYDRFGNLSSVTDPAGATLRQQFSPQGILQSSTDWEGHVSRYQFDLLGNLIRFTDPLGHATHYTYNKVGLVTRIDYPDNTTEHYEYDAADNLIRYQDPNGAVTHYEYGLCNRLMERIDPLGRYTSFGWSTELTQLEELTNAKGETYQFDYDALGQIIKEIGYDGKTLEHEYDAAGQRIATLNGLGERIEYHYDKLGNLTEQIQPDGRANQYRYDATGLLIAAHNPDSTLVFERDPVGRIITETQNGHRIQRTYQPGGDLGSLQLDNALSHHYQFDHNGLLKQVQINQNQAIKITRDARGGEILRDLGNGTHLQQAFDNMGRLAAQTTSRENSRYQTMVQRQYWYQQGLLTGISDQESDETQYSYDPAERLVRALREHGASERFTYDDNDNIEQCKTDDTPSMREYDSGDHLTNKDNTEYEYDDQGRLSKKTETDERGKQQVHTYAWNALDQLTAFTNPDGETWHYAYDPFGRRIRKVAPDKTEQHFIWDGDVILQERTGEAEPINWLFDPHSFAPLAKEENGQLYTIINDHLGTPHEILGPQGNLVWQARYSSWGEINHLTRPQIDCPVRFQGQWADDESGLYYNRFRYYDPETGRYISDDPIGLLGGDNLSAYVINPAGWIDPFGLLKTVIFPPDKVIAETTIKLQGSRNWDFKEANKNVGLNGKRGKPTIGSHKIVHGDVVWHHATYDPKTNTATMQLVTSADHNASKPHKGSVKAFEVGTDTKYGSKAAKDKAKELNRKQNKCG